MSEFSQVIKRAGAIKHHQFLTWLDAVKGGDGASQLESLLAARLSAEFASRPNVVPSPRVRIRTGDLVIEMVDAAPATSPDSPSTQSPSTQSPPTQSPPTQSPPTHSPSTTAADDLDEGPTSTAQVPLWDRLRELEGLLARVEFERAELLARLVETQFEQDRARQERMLAGPERVLIRPRSLTDLRVDAQVGVVDTATTTLGGPRRTWVARAAFGTAPPAIGEAAADAVRERAITFEQACVLVRDTDPGDVPELTERLTPQRREALCGEVLRFAHQRADVSGVPLGQEQFRGKLRREVVKVIGTPARQAAAVSRRRTWVSPADDGTADFGITGPDARCFAAQRRIDAIARAVRAGGDPRTLAQLRADVALDLLCFGAPPADAPTSIDHPADGGWPAAIVNVVVSAASLLGLNDEPGLVEGEPVAAHVVRQVALARGGTWQRIVTDPVTGFAMDQVFASYRPPADLARAVATRDGTCRVPGCHRPAVRCQLDHVTEKRHGGVTCGHNLQGLCQLHHSKKTRGHWGARLDPDGTVTWTMPDGRDYTTLPTDYRELGLDTVDPNAPATSAGGEPSAALGLSAPATPVEGETARAVDPITGGDPDVIPIARRDLLDLEVDAKRARRRIDTLTTDLATARAALHAHLAATRARDAALTDTERYDPAPF